MVSFNITNKIRELFTRDKSPVEPLRQGWYTIEYPRYVGMWVGFYRTKDPIKATKEDMILERCFYDEPTLQMYKIPEGARSLQAKYFIQCIIDDYPHTIIFEMNMIEEDDLWVQKWTYGEEFNMSYCHKKRFHAFLIPTMRNGKILQWLKETKGWNRHCNYWLGYDSCWCQHFVKIVSI